MRRKELLFTLLCGLLLTGMLGWLAWNASVAQQRRLFESEADSIRQIIFEHIHASDALAKSVQALFHSSLSIDADQFRVFSQELVMRYPFISAVTYYPHLKHQDRQPFEEEQDIWGTVGFQVFEFHGKRKAAAAARPAYFPALYREPLKAADAVLLGYDALADKTLAPAIRLAITSGLAAPSALRTLADREGYDVFIASYEGKSVPKTPEERQKTVNGLLSLTIMPASLLEASHVSKNMGIRLENISLTTPESGDTAVIFAQAPATRKSLFHLTFASSSLIRISAQQFTLFLSRNIAIYEIELGMFSLATLLGLAVTVGTCVIQQSRANLRQAMNQLEEYAQNLTRTIAELRQAENALRASEARYRSLFDGVPVGLYRTTPNGQELDANFAFSQLLGYPSREALFAQSSQDFYVDQTDRIQWQMLMAQQDVVRDFEAQWRRDDGVTIWVKNTGRAIRNTHGLVAAYEGSLEDITERKRAEKELARYREHLEELVNERTAELSQTLDDLQAAQQELIQAEKMAALGKLVANIAHEINTPLGAIRASTRTILTALDETFLRLIEVIRLLSDEQQAVLISLIQRACQPKQALTSKEERQRRRALTHQMEDAAIAQADTIADTLVDMGIYEEIAAFMPLFRHEKTIWLLGAAANIAAQRHSSENILFAVERMSKIVFALKSYAHVDASGQPTVARIQDGMEVVLTLYHNQLKHGIEVVKRYDDIPPISCYPDELQQVWTNLIHNAMHAMQGKGRLEIAMKPTPAPSEEGKPTPAPSGEGKLSTPLLGGAGGGSGIVVEITDSGCGIPPEITDRIFEPFFTTKPAGEGSGLGLDICRKIIEKHHGKIEVESQPGRTTFRVWLPQQQK